MSEAQAIAQDTLKSNESVILRTLNTIVQNRECVEVRVLTLKNGWMGGFYDSQHLDKLAHDAIGLELKSKGIYVTLNSTNPDLLARRSNRIEIAGKGELTSDNDVTHWDYLPIDVDAKRASGISSTQKELDAAFEVTTAAIDYLTGMGFPEPLIACSGNGWHVLYRIDLTRSRDNDTVVKKFLYAMSKKFNTEPDSDEIKIGIDVTNNNPSRIFKLYGTWARKGENTAERPHRLSYIRSVPAVFEIVSVDKINAVIYSEKLEEVVVSKGKKKTKAKNPKDVVERHPEFLTITGQMMNNGQQKSAIWAAIQDVNKNFEFPKDADTLTKEFEDIYTYIEKRQKDIDNLPSYIIPMIDEETGAITGYRLDYIKYSDYLAEIFGTVYFNDTIYLYDSSSHVYVPSVNEVETHIRDTMVEYGVKTTLTKTIQEVIKHLESMGGFREYPFNCDIKTLPVKNGILEFDFDNGTTKLLPHEKKHLFTYTLDVDYDKDAPTENVLTVLKQWVVGQNDVIRLVQAPAQALVQMQTRHSHKKAYMFQGETNSGKTSYFKLLIKMFTKDFVSAASLQQLCEDRFVGYELEGKILNIRDDLKSIPLNTCEQFKQITGDCSIRVEQKYKAGYRGWATAVMMFSCNYPPRCEPDVKKDSAFWDRMEYIKFPFSFAKNTSFYDDTYTPKFMSGFLNLVIETMMRIHSTGSLPVITAPGEVLASWSADADPIQMFIEDTFEKSAMGRDFDKSKTLKVYIAWCRSEGIDETRIITTINEFTSAIAPYLHVEERRLPKNKDGKREHIRVYSGAYVISGKDENGEVIDLEPSAEQTKIAPIDGEKQ